MSSQVDTSEPRHPIRVVTERTGLSPDVLRAWERRYGAVTPARGDGRHRLYSDADIDRLTLLVRATQPGRAVGAVARLTSEELEQLVAEDGDRRVARPTPAQSHLASALEAVADMSPERLETVLRRAMLSLGVPAFQSDVLGPLLDRVGEGWNGGALTIAHEHLATTVIERLLGWTLRELTAGESAPRLLMATPAGERHGLGALMAGVVAAADGWHVTWLGTDLPATEIGRAARRDAPDLVGLSVVSRSQMDGIVRELTAIRRALPADIPILLGGRGSHQLSPIEGIVMVRDLPHWHALLHTYMPAHLVSA